MNEYMGLEKGSGGFKAYAKEEEKIQKEIKSKKEIMDLLEKLKIGRFSPVNVDRYYNKEKTWKGGEINFSSEENEKYLKVFVNHPERIDWLRSFVSSKMEALKDGLPEGTDINQALNRKDKWVELQKKLTKEQIEKIYQTARDIRDEFRNKFYDEYMNEDYPDEAKTIAA